jgi:hypothetical protein
MKQLRSSYALAGIAALNVFDKMLSLGGSTIYSIKLPFTNFFMSMAPVSDGTWI